MNNRQLFLLISLLLAVPWLITGCGRQTNNPAAAQATENEPATTLDAAAPQDRLFRIVTTTTQATDLTKILTQGVPGLKITALMGAGVDPHLYQPTEADIAAMNAANMVIYSGLHLEGQFDAVFAALGEQGILVYSLGQPVKKAGFIIGAFEAEGELLGADDPHFWFDPRNWELTTLDLAAVLATMDPEHEENYQENAAAYIVQLQLLYEWANQGMRSVPAGQRYLVTSHDAFQYFGAAFGWRMAAIQGISTEAEAGVGDIQGTVNFVIDNQIPVLFVESSLSPNTIQAVQSAIAANGGQVRLGVRQLYSDAMGEPGTFGGTYIGMTAANVMTILQSYQCAGIDVTIPPWPADLTPTIPPQITSANC